MVAPPSSGLLAVSILVLRGFCVAHRGASPGVIPRLGMDAADVIDLESLRRQSGPRAQR